MCAEKGLDFFRGIFRGILPAQEAVEQLIRQQGREADTD